MGAPLSEVTAMYNSQAEKYEEGVKGELSRYGQEDRLRWLASAAQSGPLVDVGCGVGDALELLSGKLGVDAARLHGVEPSAELRARAAKRNPHAALHDAEAAKLPLESGTAGGLLCLCVLQHVTRDEGFAAVLAEWRRVLQPGAPVLLSVWEGSGTCDWGPVTGNLYKKEEVEGKFAAHGFKVEKAEQVESEWGMDFLFFQAVLAGKPAL